METIHLCCESSLKAGEPLYATASRVDVWLLLEYTSAWGAKALPESNLPDRIKSYLNQQQENIPNTRFQFIKRSDRSGDSIRFYIARSNQEHPALYKMDLQTYGDLLDLDIPAIASGQQTAPVDEQLFIVCTNARRDTCCARNGVPLARAMTQIAGEAVWETTHLGGHRFAGTMAILPHGLYYGRVVPDQASTIVENHRRGEIVLENYRGCSAYDASVQAADYYIREQTGLRRIADLVWDSSETLTNDRWNIRFKAKDGQTHTIQIHAAPSDFEIYESTPNTEKNRVTQYHIADRHP